MQEGGRTKRGKRRSSCSPSQPIIGSLLPTTEEHSGSCDNNDDDESGTDATRDVRRIEEQTQKLLLARYNRMVVNDESLPDSIWMEWLWSADPLQECHMDLMLNRMHLLGLLVAKYRARKQVHLSSSRASLADILLRNQDQDGSSTTTTTMHRLCLFDNPVQMYTLRQLLDTVLNIQVLTCILQQRRQLLLLAHVFAAHRSSGTTFPSMLSPTCSRLWMPCSTGLGCLPRRQQRRRSISQLLQRWYTMILAALSSRFMKLAENQGFSSTGSAYAGW